MDIAVFIGTRPEMIKCSPLFVNNTYFKPVIVRQHTDILSMCDTDHIIEISDKTANRLTNIVTSILHSDVFQKKWKAVLVQGDTVVAMAAALAAFHNQIPIIHLEAGLRTYDLQNPYPEEGYRKMIDAIANIALCPTTFSADNLKREGFRERIEIVGNTSIDVIASYNLKPHLGNTVIITLHRRENWSHMKDFFIAIESLANKYPLLQFIFPIHPNPLIQQHKHIFQKVQVVDPMDHRSMCEILASCNCIISDSGGIQEEASFLGKRVYCCRKVTERVEIAKSHLTFTPTPELLVELFSPQTEPLSISKVYGTGFSYLKINSIINDIING